MRLSRQGLPECGAMQRPLVVCGNALGWGLMARQPQSSASSLVSDKPAKPHIPRIGSECLVVLPGLSGSIDLVGLIGIDDDRHSVEPHDFPDPWVRKRHGLVSQPPFLPPLAPLRRV